MTKRERQRLDIILGKIEALQNATRDAKAAERLNAAKSELLRIWNDE
jgi:hypothetical protein